MHTLEINNKLALIYVHIYNTSSHGLLVCEIPCQRASVRFCVRLNM